MLKKIREKIRDWDREGAVNTLKEKRECAICGQVKPVYVVFTMHGKTKNDGHHFPICSSDCNETMQELYLQAITDVTSERS